MYIIILFNAHLFIAHELGVWLLHYSRVVLHSILPVEYYQHHLLLIEGIYLLVKEEVSDGDIAQSQRVLKHYCFLFGSYYGILEFLPLTAVHSCPQQ